MKVYGIASGYPTVEIMVRDTRLSVLLHLGILAFLLGLVSASPVHVMRDECVAQSGNTLFVGDTHATVLGY